jgi:hypothetical protein
MYMKILPVHSHLTTQKAPLLLEAAGLLYK